MIKFKIQKSGLFRQYLLPANVSCVHNAAEQNVHLVSLRSRGERPDVWDDKPQCAYPGCSHPLYS